MLPDAFADAAVAIPGGAGMVGEEWRIGGGGSTAADDDESEEDSDEVLMLMRGERTRSGGRRVYLYGIAEKCERRWRSTRAMPQTLDPSTKEDDGI